VIGKGRLAIGQVEKCVDKVFLIDDLVDHACQSGLIELYGQLTRTLLGTQHR
jgi:hypothetical protein